MGTRSHHSRLYPCLGSSSANRNPLAKVCTSMGACIGTPFRLFASCPKDEQEKVLAEEPEMKKDWDEKVGDRMIKMVIIGRHMDKEQICKDLDACLD